MLCARMVLAVALAAACALSLHAVSAQQPRDPLIDPPEGGPGSRFQIVGQSGWTPGATVTLRLAFTSSPDPLVFAGPFPAEHSLTVLADGTWSFPAVVNDDLLGVRLGAQPGYIVIRAESGARVATNAFIYAPGGVEPAGVAALGFGPPAAGALWLALSMLVAGAGGLLVLSGAWQGRQGRFWPA